MDAPSTVCLTIEGYLDCFQLGAVMNKIVMNKETAKLFHSDCTNDLFCMKMFCRIKLYMMKCI